jgi:hypothetical protein
MDTDGKSRQGVRTAATQLAHSTIGRNPTVWGGVFIALVIVLIIFVVLFIVYRYRYKECDRGRKGGLLNMPGGNLMTGGNNPLWHNQSGDAGWGGSMHTISSRGPQKPMVAEGKAKAPASSPLEALISRGCDSVDPEAIAEARDLVAAHAYEPVKSAKNMSDEALIRVMNGENS